MPNTFECKRLDPWLQQDHAALALLIMRDQTSTEYLFEFHGGHEQGNPVYIRLPGDKTGSNIAKFTTEGKTATNFAIVNQGYLLQDDPRNRSKPKIKQRVYDDMVALIRANWVFFQRLAAA